MEVSGRWIDNRRKPVPEWVAGVTGVFLRLPSGWLCNMASLCSSWLPPPLRENGKRREKGARDGHSGNSEGSDVIERVVQLLADGLVLQFLSIQLVYEQEVEGRGARTWRMIKRWRVSKGGVGAIPTRQEGKGNA